MATITRRVRVANPRRKRVAKKRTARKAPAIRRYNVKALKSELKRRGVTTKPKAAKKRRVRRSNPVLIELGAINPRRKSVATKRKRRKTSRNPRRRRAVSVARVSRRRNRRAPARRRRRNPMSTTVVRRRTTRVYNRKRRRSYRRNPAVNRGTLEKGAGVLVGVAATKFLPTLLPANLTAMTSGMGGFGPVLITGAGAFVAGWIAERFVRGNFAEGVFMGGVAQTISAALNVFLPNLAGQLALRGVGDIVPGRYVVPQNPLMLPAPMPMAAGNGMGAAAFPSAF